MLNSAVQPRASGASAKIWRKALQAFAPYKLQIVGVVVAVAVTSAIGVANALIIRAIFDDGIKQSHLAHLAIYCGLLVVLPLISYLIAMKQALWSTQIGQSVMRDFRTRLYAHFQRMPMRFYSDTKAGEIQSRFIHDVGGLQTVVTNISSQLVGNIASVFGSLAAMIYISPALSLVTLLMLPAFLLNTIWTAKARRDVNRQRQKALAEMTGQIQEMLGIGGVLLTKLFGRQEFLYKQFERQNDRLIAIEMRRQRVVRIGLVGIGATFAAIPAIVYLIGGWQLISARPIFGAYMTAGTLVAFMAIQARLYGPAGQLLNAQVEASGAMILFERIFEALEMPVELVDRPNALRLKRESIRGAVSFRDVTFSYHSRKGDRPPARPTLANITFSIEPGQTVALVGPSGAGKTTIAYLIPRLFDVDSGVVAIDGCDVRDVALESLCDLVGIVTQDPFLVHASIRENLLYGRPEATEAEMIAAAKAAAIHNRICELEGGYDAVVGERGAKLSAGERQRLAIARVMLKNPPFLILDEATSALDSASEHLVQAALETLKAGRTTIVIAHRLGTIVNADQILVIDKGAVVGRGTHAELLAEGGLYANLTRLQSLAVPA